MDAEDVLATRSTLRTTRSAGRPSSAAAASTMRAFAWWATNRSRSSARIPARASASVVASTIRRTAWR
jgi:hypothetical protein